MQVCLSIHLHYEWILLVQVERGALLHQPFAFTAYGVARAG